MSNMLVTIWNSAIASRLTFGWPNPEPATRCVICWPSRLSWNAVGRDALDHQRELLPVAALQRQFRHLAAVDVS
jgi:hypothetical protein